MGRLRLPMLPLPRRLRQQRRPLLRRAGAGEAEVVRAAVEVERAVAKAASVRAEVKAAVVRPGLGKMEARLPLHKVEA